MKSQIFLLMRKRIAESKRQPSDILGLLMGSVGLLLEIYLFYAIPPSRTPGSLELFLVPVIVTSFSQRGVAYIMSEKSGLLIESMRMMGLSLYNYWLAYFIWDGVCIGFICSLFLSFISNFGLFNHSSIWTIFGLFFVSCMSNVTFSYVFIAINDTSRTALFQYSIVTICLYFMYFLLDKTQSYSNTTWQIICCLIPPLACPLAVGTIRDNYSGISLGTILTIMMGDTVVYLVIAWYLSETYPTKYSISKPLNFILKDLYAVYESISNHINPHRRLRLYNTPTRQSYNQYRDIHSINNESDQNNGTNINRTRHIELNLSSMNRTSANMSVPTHSDSRSDPSTDDGNGSHGYTARRAPTTNNKTTAEKFRNPLRAVSERILSTTSSLSPGNILQTIRGGNTPKYNKVEYDTLPSENRLDDSESDHDIQPLQDKKNKNNYNNKEVKEITQYTDKYENKTDDTLPLHSTSTIITADEYDPGEYDRNNYAKYNEVISSSLEIETFKPISLNKINTTTLDTTMNPISINVPGQTSQQQQQQESEYHLETVTSGVDLPIPQHPSPLARLFRQISSEKQSLPPVVDPLSSSSLQTERVHPTHSYTDRPRAFSNPIDVISNPIHHQDSIITARGNTGEISSDTVYPSEIIPRHHVYYYRHESDYYIEDTTTTTAVRASNSHQIYSDQGHHATRNYRNTTIGSANGGGGGGGNYNILSYQSNSPLHPMNSQDTHSSISNHHVVNMDNSAMNSSSIYTTPPSIVIHKLRKTYHNSMVVSNLSLNVYENEIFALLGHNGAGKTTLVNMLVGLTTVDDICRGYASVYGHNTVADMDSIRTSLGICTQQDLLFPLLNVEEHLILYLQLKGLSYTDSILEASKLLSLFQLTSRKYHKITELSGGEKRKLSVAIAICGNSKFIILDEPSAGLDVEARHQLWSILRQLKTSRTILLTTHYMDEAEMLGDRIGIMAHGKMQVIGTSRYLKQQYGLGYRLILERNLSTSTTHNTSPTFGGVLNHTKQDQLHRLIIHYIPSAICVTDVMDTSQIIYRLPLHSQKDFSKLFQQLENHLYEYGLSSFGLTDGSLEDVFFKFGGELPESYNHDLIAHESITYSHEHRMSENSGSNGNVASFIRFHQFIDGRESRSRRRNLSPNTVKNELFKSQVYAMILRKFYYAYKDRYTYVLYIPAIICSLVAAVMYSTLKAAMSNLPYILNDDDNYNSTSTHYNTTLHFPWMNTTSLNHYNASMLSPSISDDTVNSVVSHVYNGFIADMLTILLYYFMFMSAPGIIGEFIVKERVERIRSLIRVEGGMSSAYWLGTLLADYGLLSVILLVVFTTWVLGDMTTFIQSYAPAIFFIIYIFFLITFTYIWSFIFTTSRSVVSTLTSLGVKLALIPIIVITVGRFVYTLFVPLGYTPIKDVDLTSWFLWSISCVSPPYTFLIGLVDLLPITTTLIPSLSSITWIIICEAALFLWYSYHLDSLANCEESRQNDPNAWKNQSLKHLADDVIQERKETQHVVINLLYPSPPPSIVPSSRIMKKYANAPRRRGSLLSSNPTTITVPTRKHNRQKSWYTHSEGDTGDELLSSDSSHSSLSSYQDAPLAFDESRDYEASDVNNIYKDGNRSHTTVAFNTLDTTHMKIYQIGEHDEEKGDIDDHDHHHHHDSLQINQDRIEHEMTQIRSPLMTNVYSNVTTDYEKEDIDEIKPTLSSSSIEEHNKRILQQQQQQQQLQQNTYGNTRNAYISNPPNTMGIHILPPVEETQPTEYDDMMSNCNWYDFNCNEGANVGLIVDELRKVYPPVREFSYNNIYQVFKTYIIYQCYYYYHMVLTCCRKPIRGHYSTRGDESPQSSAQRTRFSRSFSRYSGMHTVTYSIDSSLPHDSDNLLDNNTDSHSRSYTASSRHYYHPRHRKRHHQQQHNNHSRSPHTNHSTLNNELDFIEKDHPVVAVENLCFHVKKGEIFGLLGANGAGKSTTISMITRDILPTSGDAYIHKHSVLSSFSSASKQLGVVYQTNALWEHISVENHLYIFARIRGIVESMIKPLVNTMIISLYLHEHRHKYVSELSGGMKRKLCVAIAMIGQPNVILLDEPCAGLDPLSRRNLRAMIMACMKDRAVVLTTHSMDEADAMCQKLAIMSTGQIQAIGSRQHLKSKSYLYYELTLILQERPQKLSKVASDEKHLHKVYIEHIRMRSPMPTPRNQSIISTRSTMDTGIGQLTNTYNNTTTIITNQEEGGEDSYMSSSSSSIPIHHRTSSDLFDPQMYSLSADSTIGYKEATRLSMSPLDPQNISRVNSNTSRNSQFSNHTNSTNNSPVYDKTIHIIQLIDTITRQLRMKYPSASYGKSETMHSNNMSSHHSTSLDDRPHGIQSTASHTSHHSSNITTLRLASPVLPLPPLSSISYDHSQHPLNTSLQSQLQPQLQSHTLNSPPHHLPVHNPILTHPDIMNMPSIDESCITATSASADRRLNYPTTTTTTTTATNNDLGRITSTRIISSTDENDGLTSSSSIHIVKYRISQEEIQKLSSFFHYMEHHIMHLYGPYIQSYTVNQPTLEQVFVQTIKQNQSMPTHSSTKSLETDTVPYMASNVSNHSSSKTEKDDTKNRSKIQFAENVTSNLVNFEEYKVDTNALKKDNSHVGKHVDVKSTENTMGIQNDKTLSSITINVNHISHDSNNGHMDDYENTTYDAKLSPLPPIPSPDIYGSQHANYVVPVSTTEVDLYYTGLYNSFGCTRPVLYGLLVFAFSLSMVTFTLSLLFLDISWIYFPISYCSFLVFIVLMFIYIWTNRQKLIHHMIS